MDKVENQSMMMLAILSGGDTPATCVSYYIKIARLGYRKEGQGNEDKNDLRLVFEIERVGQLFEDYKKVKLEIWRTFTDTTMENILAAH